MTVRPPKSKTKTKKKKPSCALKLSMDLIEWNNLLKTMTLTLVRQHLVNWVASQDVMCLKSTIQCMMSYLLKITQSPDTKGCKNGLFEQKLLEQYFYHTIQLL